MPSTAVCPTTERSRDIWYAARHRVSLEVYRPHVGDQTFGRTHRPEANASETSNRRARTPAMGVRSAGTTSPDAVLTPDRATATGPSSPI